MDLGMRAIWYDLPDEGRNEYFDWLHGRYLPKVLNLPGRLWAAHYEITGGGREMNAIGSLLARAEMGETGTGTRYLLLIGAGSPHVFFKPVPEEIALESHPSTKEMEAKRIGARFAVFTEEGRVNGPEYDQKVPSGTSGPAIQMGSFRTKTIADEFDLAAWYAQYRFPAVARMPGCIQARKLVSVAGWAKHAVLYEFTSLESRQKNFQKHESLALDEKVWTNKIIRYTVHAPGSPSVGIRLWPPV
jgi:hypothetical protein